MAVLTQSNRGNNSRNPILWQELNYQQRTAPRWTRRWRLLGPLALALVIGAIIFTLSDLRGPSQTLATYAIWTVEALTAARAIIAGANSISREHVGQTWDALVLTGVSARQILYGKWQAALHRVGGWMLGLGVLRLVMLPVFMQASANRFIYFRILNGAGTGGGGGGFFNTVNLQITWSLWPLLFAVVGSVILTLLEVSACTALGLAASAIARRGALAMVLALSLRFVPIAIFAGLVRYQLNLMRSARIYGGNRFTAFALADSGTQSIAMLMQPTFTDRFNRYFNDPVVSVLMVTLMLAAITVISLWAAWLAIRRTGALPHVPETEASPAFSTSTTKSETL